VAARPKASDKPAESKPSVEEASKALNEALAQADPADAEQPKPVEPAKADEPKTEAEAEKPASKKLGLSEIRGDVEDGKKVYIGVEIWGGANKGDTQNAPFVIPKAWKIVGPASRPGNVHAMNVDLPDRTLCRLPTNWTSGLVEYPDDKWITCEPCARRLIAVKKLTQADHDQRKAAAAKARDDALKAVQARVKADAEAKAKAQAATPAQPDEPKEEPKPDEPKPPVEPTPKPEAKPDPKPTARQRRRRPTKAA